MSTQVIVVGGGLAGLSAAHTCLQHGCNVVMVDKSSFMGGNSTKATSGINGALTRTQRNLKIPDSPEIFEQDSLRGGANQPDLIKVLTHESAPAVDWLVDDFGLDLSLVSRLGGHSQPRTHRGKEKFPGMTITYALMEALEDIEEKGDGRAKILLKCRASKLIMKDGVCVGLEYKNLKTGETGKEMGPVILATGGYGADYEEDSILAANRPDLGHLPTTNGEHCTGDGIKMALRDANGDTVDLNWVQVHPTGLVHPEKKDEKVLFLAAEALRGCGGVLLDNEGNRFANELGRRDYVTGRMWDCKKGPYRLCLNGKASKEIEWHCKHYKGRGLMKFYNNMGELANEMKIDVKTIDKTFKEYNEYAKKQETSPNEGPHDAYGGGKTHDPWGKKFFHNYPVETSDAFHVAIVTPVVHYTMGGVKVDPKATLVDKSNKPIPGLYGAGEINGGIHGENRLGGSSLLDCVVYGRVAGRSASKHMNEINSKFVAAKM